MICQDIKEYVKIPNSKLPDLLILIGEALKNGEDLCISETDFTPISEFTEDEIRKLDSYIDCEELGEVDEYFCHNLCELRYTCEKNQ